MEHLEAFEAEVKGRSKGSGMNRNMHALFDTLAGRSTTTFAASGDYGGLVPVNPSRFQVSGSPLFKKADQRVLHMFILRHSVHVT